MRPEASGAPANPGKWRNSRYAAGSSDLSKPCPPWGLTKGVVTYSLSHLTNIYGGSVTDGAPRLVPRAFSLLLTRLLHVLQFLAGGE